MVRFCDSDRIQTCNLLIRSQMLYSVELRSHFRFAIAKLVHFFHLSIVFPKFFIRFFHKRRQYTINHSIKKIYDTHKNMYRIFSFYKDSRKINHIELFRLRYDIYRNSFHIDPWHEGSSPYLKIHHRDRDFA